MLYPASKEFEGFTEWLQWFVMTMVRKPFFHIFGELYDEQIGFTKFGGMEWGCVSPLHDTAYNKDDDNFSTMCPDYNWISRILLGLYMLTEGVDFFYFSYFLLIKKYNRKKYWVGISSTFSVLEPF